MVSVIEACVENPDEAMEAEKRGAHRLELCSQLELDGLTPSAALVREVLGRVQIPVKVMIRPRPGDFVYTDDELRQMVRDIRQFAGMGIAEMVTGVLTKASTIDLEALRRFTAAHPAGIFTFHKAIDETEDPCDEIQRLKAIPQFKYVLTSGQAGTALEGQKVIRQMQEEGGGELTVIAAGKIKVENLEQVKKTLPGCEYHGRRIV